MQPQKRMKYYHQKGWIANHFFVKNNLNNILKTRQKKANQTIRTNYHHEHTPIHFRSTQFSHHQKPFTAPNRMRPSQSREATPSSLQDKKQFSIPADIKWLSRYSNFKATLTHRKPLLFMKPYQRNRTTSQTIDQTKREVYKQINNPDLSIIDQVFHNRAPIEYLTEYTEPTPTRGPPISSNPKPKVIHRTSLNVLRQKLKRRSGTQVNKISVLKCL